MLLSRVTSNNFTPAFNITREADINSGGDVSIQAEDMYVHNQ